MDWTTTVNSFPIPHPEQCPSQFTPHTEEARESRPQLAATSLAACDLHGVAVARVLCRNIEVKPTDLRPDTE